MSVSHCSQGGGSLRDEAHARSKSPGAGGVTAAPWPTSPARDEPTTTPPRATARGVDPYPDDDDPVSSSSPAPVLDGARNCGSSQTQELLHDGRHGVYPYPPDPWFVTRGLRVRVRVRSKIPAGYPCGSLITSTLRRSTPHSSSTPVDIHAWVSNPINVRPRSKL